MATNPTGLSPSSITTGCTIWLDAADVSTIVLSGANMTQWNDKSGNSNNAVAFNSLSNAVNQPNFQNGNNVLNFSGNNIYRGPSGSGIYPSDVYVIVALKSITARSDVIGIGPTSTDNFNSLTFSEYTANRWHNGSSSFTRTPNTVAPANETTTGFLLMNWSIANNNFILRRNTILLSQTASYTYTPSAGSVYQIGFRYPPGSTPDINLNAYIGEIIAYNTQLSDTNRVKVEGYLAWKWGLVSSLPSTHPYKLFPFIPTIETIPRFIPQNISLVPINTYSTIKTLTLPVVSTNPGRMIILKDYLGYANINNIYISTVGRDRIENSNESYMILSNSYGAWTFMNDGIVNWFLTNAYLNTFTTIQFSPLFNNFLWTQFRNITSSAPSTTAGGSGWGAAIGTAGAYNPINYQDGDSRAGQSDHVGVVCKGYFFSSSNTTVQFRMIIDDGGVVFFNGANVLQSWILQGDTTYTSGSLNVTAGYNPIQFNFFEWEGGMTCELYYSVAGGAYQSDGTGRFFYDESSKIYP